MRTGFKLYVYFNKLRTYVLSLNLKHLLTCLLLPLVEDVSRNREIDCWMVANLWRDHKIMSGCDLQLCVIELNTITKLCYYLDTNLSLTENIHSLSFLKFNISGFEYFINILQHFGSKVVAYFRTYVYKIQSW